MEHPIWASILLIVGAYVLGALPIIRIIAWARRIDTTGVEDLHLFMWHEVGRVEGFLGVFGDFAKGIAAVLIARALGFHIEAVAFAGVATVTGQMWPVFSRFDGEKGNSTGLGMVATLDSIPVLIALIPIAIGAAVRTIPRLMDSSHSINRRLKLGGPPSRSLPLGMIIGFAVLPLASWLMARDMSVTLAFLAVFVLIAIRRVTAGLRQDLRTASDKRSVLLNRLLYDRGFL